MQTPSSGLCDYCHIKPKYQKHRYCGKTCAARAIAQCDFCRKKPKSNGHRFCSRTCANQARQQQLSRMPHAAPTPNIMLMPTYGQNGTRSPLKTKKESLPIRLLRAINILPKNQGAKNSQTLLMCGASNLNTGPPPQVASLGPGPLGQRTWPGVSAMDVCIMCRQLPAKQGTRFCGRNCKKLALRKTS